MSCRRSISFLLIVLFQSTILLAAPNIEAGKASFKNNCATCHNKNMKDNLTGPAIGGSVERWASYPKEDLYNWIRNSQKMIASGHPRAVELWAQFKPTVMTAFPNLSDEEIESILMYVDGVYTGSYGQKLDAGNATAAVNKPEETGTPYWYYIIFTLLLTLAIFLYSIMNDLAYSQKLKAGQKDIIKTSAWDLLTSKSVITFVLFAMILFGSYTTVNNAISLGRQQDYAPEQPIKFLHSTHAGLNKIDCNYCHDGARRSKQSVIPAANTCMNCHKAIKKGSKFGTTEITKIFASVGFDPTTDKYIENYEKLSNEKIEEIYTKWIGDNYLKDNNLTAINESVTNEISVQWKEIKGSLTSESKPNIPGPIE
ncbi:MAG: c-type cytochrome, partial [Bacteroidota bacterium]|nr:c-type cytochrome [Bacteroidota bacterium]